MMAAWPIEWHENNLKNFRENYARKQEESDRLVGELLRWHEEINWRQAQIDEAKKRGQKEFDSEKFMKKRRTPAASPPSPKEKP
jgi:hypothetical protein